jgi:hypothetical protein
MLDVQQVHFKSARSEEGFAIECEKFVSVSGVSFTSSASRTERNSWPGPNLKQYPCICLERLKENDKPLPKYSVS